MCQSCNTTKGMLANTRHALVINTDLPLLSPSPLLLCLVWNVASSSALLSLSHTHMHARLSHIRTHLLPLLLPASFSLILSRMSPSFSLSLSHCLSLHRKAKFSTRQEVWGCAAGRGALDLLTGSRRGEKNKKNQKKLLKENYVKRKEWCQLPQRCWIICLWKYKQIQTFGMGNMISCPADLFCISHHKYVPMRLGDTTM